MRLCHFCRLSHWLDDFGQRGASWKPSLAMEVGAILGNRRKFGDDIDLDGRKPMLIWLNRRRIEDGGVEYGEIK